MNRDRLCNGTVRPVKGDDGMVFFEYLVGQALLGLATSGETMDAGRLAVSMANHAIDAMELGRYGDKPC